MDVLKIGGGIQSCLQLEMQLPGSRIYRLVGSESEQIWEDKQTDILHKILTVKTFSHKTASLYVQFLPLDRIHSLSAILVHY